MKVLSAVLGVVLSLACPFRLWAGDVRLTRAALIEDARQLLDALESAHPDPYSSGGGKIAFHRRFHQTLAAIPADLRTALRQAALVLDTRAVADTIEKITGLSAQVGTGLQTLAQQYRYDQIVSLLDKAGGH